MIPKNPEVLNSIRGQLLVAMPQIEDKRFRKSVILMCQFDSETAMGLIINKPQPKLDLDGLCKKLKLSPAFFHGDMPIYDGGPVENTRGFVIHSQDQMLPDSLPIGDGIAMSTQLSMIKEIAAGTGPKCHQIMLGYAGWDKGQLESEMKEGSWFHLSVSADFIFNTPFEKMWHKCFEISGFDAASLSPNAGSA